MKKTLLSGMTWVLALLLVITGCNEKDDEVNIILEDLELTVDENPEVGFSLGTIESNASISLTFSIASQTPEGAIAIDEETGELTVADPDLFDFETNPEITATISAEEAQNTASVTITLNDVNELSIQDFSISIDENPTNGQSLGTIQANGDGTLSFSITSSTPSGALNIDAGTGELTVADSTLFDFETNPVITAEISIDNSGNVQTLTATINLNDVNELTVQDFTISVDENPSNGQTLGTIQASGDGTLSFSITSSTPTGALSIDSDTGELTVADSTLFDFETNPVITAEISIENSGSVQTITGTINLNDVNELTVQDFSVSIDENPSNGQSLGTVEASGEGTLSFSITSATHTGALSIDAATGELTVADATLFDFETNPVITAEISVENSGSVQTLTATINLNDVNELTVQDFSVSIDENPSNGQSLGTVEASGEGTLSFSITAATPTGALTIDASTGELTVADATLLDYETNPVITAEVSVDQSGNVQTLTATINLNDVNEFTVQDFTASIDENPSNGQSLGTVEASGEGTLSYSITSATPTGALTIDASTGELTVADATLFDFETNPVITAEVSVDQSGSVQTLTATINLNNVSELHVQDLSAYINENPSNGQYIGSIYATGDGPISYTITTQYPAGAVDIDPATGQLTVADSALFDYEQHGSVEVNVYVENSGNTEYVLAFIYISNEREIGDYAYGGVIFWMNETKDEGLVCTISDLNNGNTIQWYNGSNINTGATATAIGTGQANTSAIVSSQGAGSYAASLCDELVLNNYSDWYLPSIDELGEIYANREIISATSSAKGGANLSIVNWSSTEQTGNVNNAYAYIFAAGQSPTLNAKANQANVRAVRSWSDF